MMKLLSIICVFVMWSSSAFAQTTQPDLNVQSEVESRSIAGEPAEPLSIRVEQAAPFELASTEKQWWEPIVPPAVSGLVGLLGALIGVFATTRNISVANNQRTNELEIKQVQERLNDFYSRFQMISEENKRIALDFKARQSTSGFRTLTALLDPAWRDQLSAADRTIVSTMVENGVALRTLIREKAALVDPKVLPYLALAAAHFSMLKLAFDGDLENDPDRFQNYVYPEKLDGVLDLEVKRLSDRMQCLLAESDKRHAPITALAIPGHLKI